MHASSASWRSIEEVAGLMQDGDTVEPAEYKCFKDEKDLPTSQAILVQIQSHYSKAGSLDDFKRYLIKKANVGFARKGGGKGKSKDKGLAGGAGDNVDDDIDDSSDANVSWNDSMKQHWHRISKRIFDGMLGKGLLPFLQ